MKDLEQRFGGVDQVLLWAGYPNLGVDARSNLDLMWDLPRVLHLFARNAVPGGLKAAISVPRHMLQLSYIGLHVKGV